MGRRAEQGAGSPGRTECQVARALGVASSPSAGCLVAGGDLRAGEGGAPGSQSSAAPSSSPLPPQIPSTPEQRRSAAQRERTAAQDPQRGHRSAVRGRGASDGVGVARQIMTRMGWRPGMGLGRANQGRPSPILPKARQRRMGLRGKADALSGAGAAGKFPTRKRCSVQTAAAGAAGAAMAAARAIWVVKRACHQLAPIMAQLASAIAARAARRAAALAAGRRRLLQRFLRAVATAHGGPKGTGLQHGARGLSGGRSIARLGEMRAGQLQWAWLAICGCVVTYTRHLPRPKEASSVVVNLTTREKPSRGFAARATARG